MTDFHARVIALSEAAWSIRRSSRRDSDLPFALALVTDDRRHPNIEALAETLPTTKDMPPLAVVFRHDRMEAQARLALARRVMGSVQRAGHLFLLARGTLPGADGSHNAKDEGFVSAPVHSQEEGRRAAEMNADLGFVSPVFATKSHPGATSLGVAAADRLAASQPYPCFALGGMTLETAPALHGTSFQGFGAIGAFTDA